MKLFARALCILMLLCVAPLGMAAPLLAQDPAVPAAPRIDQRKLLVQPRNGSQTLKPPSVWHEPLLWITDKQRSFYGAMSLSIRKLKSQSPYAAALTLMLLSFGYGVFHAAGPGHGKAVISAWLLATDNELRRGILIAFMSAIVQALTAIAIVSALLVLVTAVGTTARDVAGFLESTSYALIASMGAYLVWTALRPHRQPEAASHATEHHHHGHHHHDHQHGADCACGHAHVPEARLVKGEWSLPKAVSLAFAVGIRPCSGALLVLIFANTLGLYWAGVTSTFVMALGTAITVSVIAAIAVYSKQLALSFVRHEETWLGRAAFALRLGGGLVIVALGGLLFWGSLFSTNTMM